MKIIERDQFDQTAGKSTVARPSFIFEYTMTVGLKQRTGRPLQTYLSFSIADSWSGMYTVIQVDCVDRNFFRWDKSRVSVVGHCMVGVIPFAVASAVPFLSFL